MPAKRKTPKTAKRRKPRSDAKLKRLPADVQWTMWLMRNPTDPTVEGSSMEAVLAWLLTEHSVSAHLSSFTDWEDYFELELRTDRADAMAEQAVQDELKRNPDASEEALDRIAARVFKAEALKKGDAKAWAVIKKSQQEDIKLDQAKEKLAQNAKALKQKDEALKLVNRRVVILEEQAAVAKRKITEALSAAKSGGGLTPETLKQIEEAAGLL